MLLLDLLLALGVLTGGGLGLLLLYGVPAGGVGILLRLRITLFCLLVLVLFLTRVLAGRIGVPGLLGGVTRAAVLAGIPAARTVRSSLTLPLSGAIAVFLVGLGCGVLLSGILPAGLVSALVVVAFLHELCTGLRGMRHLLAVRRRYAEKGQDKGGGGGEKDAGKRH